MDEMVLPPKPPPAVMETDGDEDDEEVADRLCIRDANTSFLIPGI